VGETRTRRADVRIVAATNRDLEADVEQGRFRLDLLYRLNVIEVRVPPLRERREDLPTLARHFIEFFARDLGRPVPQLSPEASELLLAYRWPGNVRELRNEMERAIVLLPGDTLWPHSFSERVRATGAQVPRIGDRSRLEDIEREHILRVLASTATREEAARVLGIDPSTLWRKLRRYETEGGSA
jgi:NtrC-family two-component system response regulator AlgB